MTDQMDVATAEVLRRRIDDAPMSRTQVMAVAVTVAISALDGYDVLSVTFAAPAIVREWGIGKAALGLVLSSGLAGMALGSLALAPIADIVGRRRMVLSALTLMAIGMLLSALSRSLAELTVFRVVTGLGIGAMVAIINPLAAEFANARRRPLAMALMTIGYPVGGVCGGVIAATLLRFYDWRAVFIAGFVAACAMLPVVLHFLPEPLAFILTRRRSGTLEQANRLLARYDQPALNALPPLPSVARGAAYAAVFRAGQRGTVARITLVNMLYVLTVYFVLSWLPQLVADLGFPASTATLVAAAANLAGIVGGITLGWLAPRVGLTRLTVITMIGTGVATAAIGFLQPSLPLIVTVAAICGFFLFGGMAGLYASLAASFSTAARASGTGFVIGVGRIASAAAPALAGWLFAGGFDRMQISSVFGAFAVMAGLILATST